MNESSLSKISIAVVNVLNFQNNVAMNKDLNGGFGTADCYSDTFFEKIIGLIKRKSIKLPIISLAYLMGIFKQKRINAKYFEGLLPSEKDNFDVILIYGSIVDYKNENRVAKQLKNLFPRAKIGFIGPFPSTMPRLFKTADFIIKGNFEKFFLQNFQSPAQLTGIIEAQGQFDLNDLPHPELDGFPVNKYGYSPAISAKPFFALQSSLGCPYSCSYYCVYGKFQGPKVLVRSPQKVADDMMYLNKKYGIKGIQFRDPTFGIKDGYIEELCQEIKKRNLKIEWGMETRIDLLDKKKIELMSKAGLRNINIGIETIDPNIAGENMRLLTNRKHQEEIIDYCARIGVKVSAFYLFGYENDTRETMRKTLKYAKKLNTFLARFAIVTPYPGTRFFEDLEKDDRLLTRDYETYTQFKPVFKHRFISSQEVSRALANAYKEYYFRPRYILMMLKWKMRGF